VSDEFDRHVNAIGHRKAVRFFAVRIAVVAIAVALYVWCIP
jgi:hypothetical protein